MIPPQYLRKLDKKPELQWQKLLYNVFVDGICLLYHNTMSLCTIFVAHQRSAQVSQCRVTQAKDLHWSRYHSDVNHFLHCGHQISESGCWPICEVACIMLSELSNFFVLEAQSLCQTIVSWFINFILSFLLDITESKLTGHIIMDDRLATPPVHHPVSNSYP